MPTLEDVPDIVESVLSDAGPDLVEAVRDLISEQYPPASAPGTPPHKRTGELRSSISYIVHREGTDIVLELAAEAPYAQYLEPTRPFLQPSLENFEPEILDRLDQALNPASPPASAPAGAIMPQTTAA